MRERRYWEVEEKRRCRLCGWEEESWEHVVEVCMGEGKGKEEILRILEDDGRGAELDEKATRQERVEGGEDGEGKGENGNGRRRTDSGRTCERVSGECRRGSEWRV